MKNRRGNKDTRQLVKRLRKQGWEVSMRKAGHIQAVSPDGRMLTFGAHGGIRALRNTRADLRRLGANV